MMTVDCIRGGETLASYDIGYGVALDGSGRPTDEQFRDDARANLPAEGLAQPPYLGIKFVIREASR